MEGYTFAPLRSFLQSLSLCICAMLLAKVLFNFRGEMKSMKRISLSLSILALTTLVLAGWTTADNTNRNTTATTNVSPPTATPATQNLSVVERPQKIKDQMTARGEQDQAKPTPRFVEPREGATITGATVNVKLTLSGDLKGYQPHKDPATGKGNHIHVILDNQPYEAYYELGQPFELRNVSEGLAQ